MTTTLEERAFQRNVPGRFSTWARDDDEREGDDDGGKSEEQEGRQHACDHDGNDAGVLAPGAAGLEDDDDTFDKGSTPSIQRRGPNTGPKGVLADHRAHQLAAHEQAQRAKAHREAVLRRIAYGPAAAPNDDDEEEEDDAFLQRYRAQRLEEMKKAAAATTTTTTNPSPAAAHPAFGTLHEAPDGPALLHLLTEAHAAGVPAVVLVHATPPTPGGRALHHHLAAVAPQHARMARFLCAAGAALGFDDPATLPLLIAYDENGQVVDSLPCADEALGAGRRPVERGAVVWWLEGAGVLLRRGRGRDA